MSGTNTHAREVNPIAASYDTTAEGVALILRRRHRLTEAEAREAIRISPLQAVFQSDPEMAAHTSNEAWAREILAFWLKNTGK